MTVLEKRLLNVHDTILNALEEDVYREYIGRFYVERAAAEKLEIRSTEERRVQLADRIKGYELHLKLGDETILGTDKKLESISFNYKKGYQGVGPCVGQPPPNHFEIRVEFPQSDDGKSGFNEFCCWEFNAYMYRLPARLADFSTLGGEVKNRCISTTENVNKGSCYPIWKTRVVREVRVTPETLDWIYDQLMTYRNPTVDEKAKQLARLLSCGDNLEGKFHYAELGGAERSELPDIAVPHEGEWRIERIDRPHRGRLFILTASKVAPDYTLMVSYSSVDNVFDGHEFRPGEEKQPRTFSKTENPHLLDKALDAIARRVGYNWK